MKYEIKAKQVNGSNFTYTLLRDGEIAAFANRREFIVEIIQNSIPVILLEKDIIEIK